MLKATKRSSRHRAAFSMLEIAIAIGIVGVVAAIAVPRVAVAVEKARHSTYARTKVTIEEAIQRYAAEHGGQSPALDSDKDVVTPVKLLQRLTKKTNVEGEQTGAVIFGPYLSPSQKFVNPFNKKSTIRIDGADAGAGLAGWRLNSATSQVLGDHLESEVQHDLLGIIDGFSVSNGEGLQPLK